MAKGKGDFAANTKGRVINLTGGWSTCTIGNPILCNGRSKHKEKHKVFRRKTWPGDEDWGKNCASACLGKKVPTAFEGVVFSSGKGNVKPCGMWAPNKKGYKNC